jgi:glycosyltransferase involved in cell wall biosynthesis
MTTRVHYFGTLPPFQGGIAQHGSRMAEGLREAGFEVLTTSWASQYPEWLYRGNQPTDADKAEADARIRFVARWWNPFDWWRVGRMAKSSLGLIEPWVTPFHALAVVVSFLAARPAPTILIVHNIETHEWFPFRTLLTKAALRCASSVIVHSVTVGDQVADLAPLTPVEVVPMPRLIEMIGSPLPARDSLRLLMVGYLRPYKGLEVALDAVDLLKDEDFPVQLVVMGEFWQPSVADVQQMIEQRTLGQYVSIRPGYVDDEHLVGALSEHHIVLLPYLTATQSAIAPLAHAAHRPVIASNLPGLAEQVDDGVDGLLFKAGSALDLANVVREAAGRLDSLYRGAVAHAELGVEEELITCLRRLVGGTASSRQR